jgi:hypothetical protein
VSLSKEVSSVIGTHTQDLHYLREFIREADAHFATTGDKQKNDMDSVLNNLSSETRLQALELFKEFAEFMLDTLKEIEPPDNVNGTTKHPKAGTKRVWHFEPKKEYSNELSDYLLIMLTNFAKPFRYPNLLYDMALTHTITLFEAFLGDFLHAIFSGRPKTLKSENMVTYEEVLSCSSIKELVHHLASNRVKELVGENIDILAKRLEDLFSVKIYEFNGFAGLREAFCRRHIIVHNKGITDKKYCQSVPNSKLGVHLSTDLPYIENLFQLIGQFIDYIDNSFSGKLRYKRAPAANLLINRPKGSALLRVAAN